MGHTIWVQTDGPEHAQGPDNSVLAALEKELTALAGALGVAPLRAFYDYSVLGEEYGDGSGAGPTETWHDASDALRSVSAIRAELVARPERLGFVPRPSRRHWPEALMKELEHCERVIAEAAKSGRKVRLLLVS